MKVTSIGFKRRMEFSTVSLIKMSAPKLEDDMKKEPRFIAPLAKCTIGEHLAAKVMGVGA